MKLIPLVKMLMLISIAACLNSCSHSFYAPNDNIMVQLKDKNELVLTGSAGPQTGSFQLGYSPAKHFAIAGSFFSLADSETNRNTISNQNSGRGNIWRGALGTYYFINLGDVRHEKKRKNEERVYSLIEPIGFLFDLYAGYGQGTVENMYPSGGQSLFDHQQYFIQGGFHFKSNFVDVGVSIKTSVLNYYNGTIIGQIDVSDMQDIDVFLRNDRFNPVEISLKVGGGWKFGKIFGNFNYLPSPNPALFSHGPNIAVGLQLNITDIISDIKSLK